MDRPHDTTPALVPEVVDLGPPSGLDLAREGWRLAYPEPTRGNYSFRFDLFRDWLATNCPGVHPFTIRRTHLEMFGETLTQRGLMDSTKAGYMGAVRSFYRWAYLEEYIDRDPTVHARMPKLDDDVQRPYLTRYELGRVLHLAQTAKSSRTFALVSVLAFTGVRIGAALSMNIETMADIKGHHTIVARTKNRKVITVPLIPRVHHAVLVHIGDRKTGPVFATSSGRSMAANYAWRTLTALAVEAGVQDKRIGCHAFRRTFITGSLDAGVPIRDVQISVHHKDPGTTAGYDQKRRSLDSHAGYAFSSFVGEQ